MGTKIWAIIPAAGTSSRMGMHIAKQYLPLNGVSVLLRSIRALQQESRIDMIHVGLAQNDTEFSKLNDDYLNQIETYIGGKSRRDTVLNGLKIMKKYAKNDDWVLVHDAARPLLTARDLGNLIDECTSSQIGGILAEPSVDTLKLVDEKRSIVQSINRSKVWKAQTPQCFRFEMLSRALTACEHVTDEAQAVELIGEDVRIIEAKDENFKVTYQADLDLAEFIMNNREG